MLGYAGEDAPTSKKGFVFFVFFDLDVFIVAYIFFHYLWSPLSGLSEKLGKKSERRSSIDFFRFLNLVYTYWNFNNFLRWISFWRKLCNFSSLYVFEDLKMIGLSYPHAREKYNAWKTTVSSLNFSTLWKVFQTHKLVASSVVCAWPGSEDEHLLSEDNNREEKDTRQFLKNVCFLA